MKSNLTSWVLESFNLGIIGKVSDKTLLINNLVLLKSYTPIASPDSQEELIIEKLRNPLLLKLLR